MWCNHACTHLSIHRSVHTRTDLCAVWCIIKLTMLLNQRNHQVMDHGLHYWCGFRWKKLWRCPGWMGFCTHCEPQAQRFCHSSSGQMGLSGCIQRKRSTPPSPGKSKEILCASVSQRLALFCHHISDWLNSRTKVKMVAIPAVGCTPRYGLIL